MACDDVRVRQGASGGHGTVRVAVLGPLRLVVDGTPVDVPGPKRRAVLALLARAEGRVVAAESMIAALWPAGAPETARATLRSHISRLRGHLGPGAFRLEAVSDGYRLLLEPDDLDTTRARTLLAQARAVTGTDPARACALLTDARKLWRGAVLADLQEVAPVAAWTVSLGDLEQEVNDCYLGCALDAGRAAEVVGQAREAVRADPLREPAVLLLMRALAATGRSAEALRVGYEFRRRLAADTGLDPTGALSSLERDIAAAGDGDPDPVPAGPGTRLVGRDGEVAAVQRLLGDERLVTIVGPGGVGKTSVALEVARRLEPATVLSLAPMTDPDAIPYALAAALDLRTVHSGVLAACAALLGAGPRTLVVDNCEHLRDGVRRTVAALLSACPRLTILATSREPLGLPPERQFRLAPLPLPDQRGQLEQVPSVAVFLDRARRVRPALRWQPEHLRMIGDIVRRLDGMPLAIELAAGRLSSLSLVDLHARLDRALDLLGNGSDASGGRHRTLRATLEWSYHLLPEHGQRLFRHLAVFPDGFDLATAERVAGELGLAADPVAVLAHLVDASMIGAELAGPARYRMLDTLRAFGLDRLAASGELDAAQDRMLRWATAHATWIAATEATAREPEADAALRREMSNLRAAWALARRLGRLDDAIGLVTALLVPATARDLTEVWAWASELADDPLVESSDHRAAVLGLAGVAAWQRGDLDEAEHLGRRGLASPDRGGHLWCHAALAFTLLSRGDLASSEAHALRAATLADRPSEYFGIAALAATYAGHLDRARSLNHQLDQIATSATLLALRSYVSGEIDNAAGDHEAAETHYREAITRARSARSTFIEGIAAVGLVTVQAAAGRVEEALRVYRELIDYWERTGGWLQQWTTLRNLAELLARLSDPEPALFLQTAAALAPDAPAVTGAVWRSRSEAGVDPAVVERIRAEASGATREEVLTVARQAVARHLARAREGTGAP